MQFDKTMKNLIETQAGARGRAELFNQRLLHLVSLEKVDAKERSNPLNRKREKGDEVGHSNMLQQSKSCNADCQSVLARRPPASEEGGMVALSQMATFWL